jgi:hypothetical protein
VRRKIPCGISFRWVNERESFIVSALPASHLVDFTFPVLALFSDIPQYWLYQVRKVFARPDASIRTFRIIADADSKILSHDQIEFHVPRAHALDFAKWFELKEPPVLLTSTVRYTGVSHETVYVSFNFDVYSPKKFLEVRAFYKTLRVPPELNVTG